MSSVEPQHATVLQDPAGGGLQGGVQPGLVAAVVCPGTGSLKKLLVHPTATPGGWEGVREGGSEPGQELAIPVQFGGRWGEASDVRHQGRLDAHRGDGVGEGALTGLGVVGPKGGLNGK